MTILFPIVFQESLSPFLFLYSGEILCVFVYNFPGISTSTWVEEGEIAPCESIFQVLSKGWGERYACLEVRGIYTPDWSCLPILVKELVEPFPLFFCHFSFQFLFICWSFLFFILEISRASLYPGVSSFILGFLVPPFILGNFTISRASLYPGISCKF